MHDLPAKLGKEIRNTCTLSVLHVLKFRIEILVRTISDKDIIVAETMHVCQLASKGWQLRPYSRFHDGLNRYVRYVYP